jgi:hypothetical protein
MTLVLRTPVMEKHGDRATLTSSLGEGKPLRLEIRAPEQVIADIEPQIGSMVPIAMILAAQERTELVIDGDLHPFHWLNLRTVFWPIVGTVMRLPDVPMKVARLRAKATIPRNGYALMFSGGIDSLYSFFIARDLGTPPSFLLNINAGAHGEDHRCWENRLANIKRFSDEAGIPVVTIDTNFHHLVPLVHDKIHTIRNMAAALALVPAVTEFAYSTTHPYAEISFAEAARSYISYLEHPVMTPILMPGATLAVLGGDASRIEKTRSVSTEPYAHRFLDICLNAGGYQSKWMPGLPFNCGRCTKCIRAQALFEVFGRLDDFSTRFPIDDFRANRHKLLAGLRHSTKQLDHELLDYLRAAGLERPRWSGWLKQRLRHHG